MVYNIITHFKKLLNSFACRGCGLLLVEEFSSCKSCENNKKVKSIEKKVDFNENIDSIVDNLIEIKYEDADNYTRDQCYRIYKKLTGKNPKQKTIKEEILKMINEELKKREDVKEKIIKDNEIQNQLGGEITLNGFAILAREDGFINATAMCKAGGKLFADWKRLESTKQLLNEFESDMGIPISQLVDVKKGNTSQFSQGSWIHPDLAIQLAQWISPSFALKVSKWIRELSLTGSVILGNEKTSKQLDYLQKEIIKRDQTIKDIDKKHKNILKKREYYKFNKGPSFYIIETKDY